MSDDAMFEAFSREMDEGENRNEEGLHIFGGPGLEGVRTDVREQAMKSVRGSTKAVYQRTMSSWVNTYRTTAAILGLQPDDHYLRYLDDSELRSLVVCRFLLQLNRVEGKKKGELGRCLAALRYFFTCEGQSTAVFGSELVTRVRDSCSYSALETRAVIARKIARGHKLPIPAGFLSDLYVGFRDIINDPTAVKDRMDRKKLGDLKILVGSAELLQMSATCLFLMMVSGVRPSNVTKPEGKEASELRMLAKDVMLVGRVNGEFAKVGLAYDTGKELVPVESLEHAMILVVDSKTGLNPGAKWVPVEPGTSQGKMLAVMLHKFACNTNLLGDDKLFSRRSINGGRCSPAVREEDGTYTLPSNQGVVCELKRSGPRALLRELALLNGLPPENFSMKCCRITYATVGQIRHEIASGTLVEGVQVDADDTDDEDEDVGEGASSSLLPAGRSAVPLLDPLGNWATNSRTQTTTYSQARSLGSGAGSFMVDGRLGQEGVSTLLLPTLNLVAVLGVANSVEASATSSADTGSSSGAGTSGSGRSQAGADFPDPVSGQEGDVPPGDKSGKKESLVLAPCCDNGPPPDMKFDVGGWSHSLETLLDQFGECLPGEDAFNAAVECGLAGYQPGHGDIPAGGAPSRGGPDLVLEFDWNVHVEGQNCATCRLAQLCNCDRYDSGEDRLALAAECVGSEGGRGVSDDSINGVPFGQCGFLHHKSCACAALPFCARVRADKCDKPTLCMAVAAKATITVLCRRHLAEFAPPCYLDWRLPHVPPLLHPGSASTIEEQVRRATAVSEGRPIVWKTRAEWIRTRNGWLNARAAALRLRNAAFAKDRREGIELERFTHINLESEEIRLLGQLAFQQSLAGLAGPDIVAVTSLRVAGMAGRTMRWTKPPALRAACSEEDLRQQIVTEGIRAASTQMELVAMRDRIRVLQEAIEAVNTALPLHAALAVEGVEFEGEGLEADNNVVTDSSGGHTQSSAVSAAATISSASAGSSVSSGVSHVAVVPVGPPTPSRGSVPLVTGVVDNSGGSSEASVPVTYVGVIPLGEPTVTRTGRLSHPPACYANEQAAGEHGSLLKRSSSSTDQSKSKKGKGGPSSDAEDHKKDEDDKGV